MIQTSAVGFDARGELNSRLTFLREVEIPRLQGEQQDGEDVAVAALLHYARREEKDVAKLLDQLSSAGKGPSQVVRTNHCVTLRDLQEGSSEQMIVHQSGMNIRAPGFISVESPLGRAVVDRRVGDVVEVMAPEGSRRYVILEISRG